MLDVMVVAPHSSLPSALARCASGPRRRRVLPPLLLLGALGAVAFVLWRQQRRRQAPHSSASSEPRTEAAPRAVLPVRLGRLRELARELAQCGREAEAGLLDNYALLLERPSVNRTRVLAEVTRMLQAAEDERNVREPAQRVWRRVPLPSRTPLVS